MFIGHYGVGFALKRANPALSLGILFIAVQFVDILWTILVFAGIERVEIVPGYTASNHFQFVHYPYTHSLAATFAWGFVTFLLFYFLAGRRTPKRVFTAAIVAFGVMSHFALDLIVHAPDLTVAGPGTPALGLGAWQNLPLSLFLEILILAVGLYIYYRATAGHGFWSKGGPLLLGLFLAVSQIMTTLGPPPPENKSFVLVGLVTYLAIVGIAFWIDRNRTTIGSKFGIRE
jgi:hypothetical protein